MFVLRDNICVNLDNITMFTKLKLYEFDICFYFNHTFSDEDDAYQDFLFENQRNRDKAFDKIISFLLNRQPVCDLSDIE